jgi:hypothetical protein
MFLTGYCLNTIALPEPITFIVCVKIYALYQTHALYVGDLEPIYTIMLLMASRHSCIN